jgi:HEPN domain-containing protein
MRATESGFNEVVYYEAALERLKLARELLEGQQYIMAAYMAGVAVECMLMAYVHRVEAPLDAQHNLFRLADAGGFFDDMTRREREALTAELGEIVSRWRNNHRYRTDKAFQDFLTRNRLFVIEGNRTTRRNLVRYNAEILVESANRIVTAGVARWPQSEH